MAGSAGVGQVWSPPGPAPLTETPESCSTTRAAPGPPHSQHHKCRGCSRLNDALLTSPDPSSSRLPCPRRVLKPASWKVPPGLLPLAGSDHDSPASITKTTPPEMHREEEIRKTNLSCGSTGCKLQQRLFFNMEHAELGNSTLGINVLTRNIGKVWNDTCSIIY